MGLRAQRPSGDPVADTAYADALMKYHSYLNPEPALYRGPEYQNYIRLLKEGHPYFGSDSMQTGTIRYGGVVFSDRRLYYDLVYDEVVIDDPYKIYKIALLSERIDSFTVGNHRFIRLTDSLNRSMPAVGFYEQLQEGRAILLKKEKKVINEELTLEEGVTRYIVSMVSYYLRKGNTYYPVNNTASLLAAMKDRAREAKRFIRTNRLSMRKDKENTLQRVIAWYNGLNLQ